MHAIVTMLHKICLKLNACLRVSQVWILNKLVNHRRLLHFTQPKKLDHLLSVTLAHVTLAYDVSRIQIDTF